MTTRLKILLAALSAAALVYFAQADLVVGVGEKNAEFMVLNYRVADEDPGHPRLALLRAREKLDAVAARGATQLEKTVLLRGWARAQWEPRAGTFRYPPWDAVEILDLARRRDNRAFCAQYAVVFVQACQAVGLYGRYVDLPGHFVAAIWNDDLGKWVLMDPYNDIHFERRGEPLNALEISRAARRGELNGLEKVSSSGARTPVTAEDLALYRQYSISRRSDHLSSPVPVRINGKPRKLVLSADWRSYPLAGKDTIGVEDPFLGYLPPGGEPMPYRPQARDADDFRRDMNLTVLAWARSPYEPGAVKLLLAAENSPGFETFLFSADGGPWQPAPSRLAAGLHPGLNRLAVRVRARGGWLGRPSELRLLYKPSWLWAPAPKDYPRGI